MISKDKQYKTRDGREVRVYATDGAGEFPIHGAVLNDDGNKTVGLIVVCLAST